MKPKTLKILTFIFLTSLIAAVALKIITKPRPPKKLTNVQTTQNIRYIKIEHSKEKYKFEKSNSIWQMIIPFRYKAVSDKLERFLQALPDITVSQIITGKKETFPDYGLSEKDRVKVTFLDKSGKMLAGFTAGSQADYSTFYIYDENKNAVSQATGFNVSFLSQPFHNWLDRSIFRSNPQDINYVAVEKGSKYLKILKDKNEWFFIKSKKSQKKRKVSPGKIDEFVKPMLDALTYLDADKVMPLNGKYAENIIFETGLKIEVSLSAEKIPAIFVLSKKNKDETYYLKIVGNQNVMFIIPAYRIKPFLEL